MGLVVGLPEYATHLFKREVDCVRRTVMKIRLVDSDSAFQFWIMSAAVPKLERKYTYFWK